MAISPFKSFQTQPKPLSSLGGLFQGVQNPFQGFQNPFAGLFGQKPATPATSTPISPATTPSTPFFPTPTGAPIPAQKPAVSAPPAPQAGTSAPIATPTPSAPILPSTAPPVAPPTPIEPAGTTPTPTRPQISPETQSALSAAEKAYIDSLKISPDELSTQEDIDRLIESTQSAFRGIQDKPIPLEFITGQLASVERRALGLAEPLERKLARMQAQRTSSLEASKFALERAEKAAGTERIESKESRAEIVNIASNLVSAGASQEQVNQLIRAKSTEEALGIAAQSGLLAPTEDGGFTLSEGQVRFDSKGKVVAANIGLGGAGGVSGTYTPGENPTVDAWVQNINSGKATLAQVPGNLKNAVSNALASGGSTTSSAVVDMLQDKIGSIDSLIDHKGMSKAVGPTGIARFTPFTIDTWTGDVQDFVGKVHQLTAKETLDFLIKLKAAGGTLGALNQKELETLEQSATAINDWEIKDSKTGAVTGKWNITESKFKAELNTLKTLTERALARATGTDQSAGAGGVEIQQVGDFTYQKGQDGNWYLIE